MRHITSRVHIDAPVDVVFACASDPERLPERWPKIRRFWDVAGHPGAIGSSYRMEGRVLGHDTVGRTEVIDADPPHLLMTVTACDNGARALSALRLIVAGDGTEAVDEVDYEAPDTLADRLTDPLVAARIVAADLALAGRALKASAEAQAAAGQPDPRRHARRSSVAGSQTPSK